MYLPGSKMMARLVPGRPPWEEISIHRGLLQKRPIPILPPSGPPLWWHTMKGLRLWSQGPGRLGSWGLHLVDHLRLSFVVPFFVSSKHWWHTTRILWLAVIYIFKRNSALGILSYCRASLFLKRGRAHVQHSNKFTSLVHDKKFHKTVNSTEKLH